jgi:hypothetical protein
MQIAEWPAHSLIDTNRNEGTRIEVSFCGLFWPCPAMFRHLAAVAILFEKAVKAGG